MFLICISKNKIVGANFIRTIILPIRKQLDARKKNMYRAILIVTLITGTKKYEYSKTLKFVFTKNRDNFWDKHLH